MTRLEKLLMRVELIDKVTGPANRVMKNFDKMTQSVKRGGEYIAGGVAGILGTGFALTQLTQDAREMNRALGEVASLGLQDAALKKLEKTALRFSVTYGESAVDFVRSAYDVQSAINGLTGQELADFTEAGNILAKGSKSSADTITNYMGTMYGIFSKNADAMGRSKWVQQMAAQTSLAVAIFKSSGDGMSAAFTSLGADATASGIAMNEQMGVLGQLQSTMPGAESGTKYKAFLRGIGKAQKDLGLTFVDSKGMMLPITDILEKIEKKYGQIDTVAKGDMMKKAFGSDEAVATLKLLINDTGALRKNIAQIGQVNGMEDAIEMAKKMVDPLDRLNGASTALKIRFGALLSKSLTPLYTSLTDNLTTLQRWIEMFPNLAGLIAKITLLIFGFTAAVSLLAIAKGVWIIAATGTKTAMTLLRLTMLPFGPLLHAIRLGWIAMNLQLLAGAGFAAAARAGFIVMANSLVGAAAAAWRFTAALLANPITWVVVGVIALIAGLYLLIKHWDAVKAAVTNFFTAFAGYWNLFRSAIESNPIANFLLAPLFAMVDAATWVVNNLDKIPEWFAKLKPILKALNPFGPLIEAVSWVIDMLGKIPGVKAALKLVLPVIPGSDRAQTAGALPASTQAVGALPMAQPVTSLVQARLPVGGISSQINNTNNNQRPMTIQNLNVNTTQPVNGKRLVDELHMAVS